MWKIFFEYSEGDKITVTGKQKDIPLRLAEKYNREYGRNAVSARYQRYPVKSNEQIPLWKKIEQLRDESEESDER